MILRPFIDTENNLLHEKNHVTLCKNKAQAHFACLWSLDIALHVYTCAVFLLSSIKMYQKTKALVKHYMCPFLLWVLAVSV